LALFTAWYGTVQYGSLLGGFPLGKVPGTFFSTASAEVHMHVRLCLFVCLSYHNTLTIHTKKFSAEAFSVYIDFSMQIFHDRSIKMIVNNGVEAKDS